MKSREDSKVFVGSRKYRTGFSRNCQWFQGYMCEYIVRGMQWITRRDENSMNERKEEELADHKLNGLRGNVRTGKAVDAVVMPSPFGPFTSDTFCIRRKGGSGMINRPDLIAVVVSGVKIRNVNKKKKCIMRKYLARGRFHDSYHTQGYRRKVKEGLGSSKVLWNCLYAYCDWSGILKQYICKMCLKE